MDRMSAYEEELCRELHRGRVMAVIGAGVSRQATDNHPAAAWTGLLEDGVRRCRIVDRMRDGKWERRRMEDIQFGQFEELLATASIIRGVLVRRPGEYRSWLRGTVGSLRAVKTDILDAIGGLRVLVATTNYDGLLGQHLNRMPVTWRNGIDVLEALRGDRRDRMILHLHGYWEDEESVILGIEDYTRILGDKEAQARQQLLGGSCTMLFIGFGAGLGDPNFHSLIEWISRFLGQADCFHYQLVREGDMDKLNHPPEAHIRLIPYGRDYRDLPKYLSKLGRCAPPAVDPRRRIPKPTRGDIVARGWDIVNSDPHAKVLRGFKREAREELKSGNFVNDAWFTDWDDR
jgi:hypothetical protein